MYNASAAFHEAVEQGKPQIALLIFDDTAFSNSDINVERGIDFNDYFCTEDDLAIGAALSNELSFSMFNDDGILDDYEFGDFTATIGAQVSETEVPNTGTVMAESGRTLNPSISGHTYVAYESSPYLRRDGTALSSQPDGAVRTILIYDGNVYCLTENGTVKVYKDSNGSVQSVSVSDTLKAQMEKWSGKGISYDGTTRFLNIWEDGIRSQYECVPLGRFCAERPNVPSEIEISFSCNDLMTKFDIDMPSSSALGINYPITIRNLLIRLCNYVGIPCMGTAFINSTATVTKEPEEFKSATMRDVVGWIAEAAASVARINRDGMLILDWLHTTDQTYDENSYQEFKPYWYRTKQISKLYNRASNGSYEHTKGTGNEAYLIQDNPLLKGVS